MKLPRRTFLHLATGAAALPAVSRFAWAQAYPTRPVRIIVGYPPGGTAERVRRLIGQHLSERLGQPFVVEDRPGDRPNIATETVVKSAPDGYTLLVVDASPAINTTLYHNLSFFFFRDIAPVACVISVPLFMVVNPAVPAKTVPEFIAYAKANPPQGQHGVKWQWGPPPSGRRAIQDDDRRRPSTCPLSRRSARAYRPHKWPSAGDVRRFDR